MFTNKQRIEGYKFNHFYLNLVVRQLSYQRKPLTLPSRTFDILKILVENSGQLVTKEELISQVWHNRFVEENNLTVRMSALRKALGQTVENRFIETVQGYGYRFVARVSEVFTKGLESREEVIDSLAVLPLINENNQQKLDYLCDGITESLITSLSQIADMRVMARSTVFRYKGHDANPQKVGKELGVRAVLVGRVSHGVNSLVFDLEVIDVKDGAYLWGAKYNRQASDLVTLQEEIAREISENLRINLSKLEEKQVAKRYTNNPHAHHLYMKGRYFWNQRSVPGVKKAIRYFRSAIRYDPRYSLAFAGLADAYIWLSGSEVRAPKEAIPKARTAALKAIDIDSQLAEARVSMGNIKASYELDWQGAEREFKLAIELNPFYAPAHQYYANLLAKFGQFEQAIVEVNKAYEIDPLSILINLTMGKIYYFARRYNEAVRKGREILEIQPRFGVANGLIGLAYLDMRRFQDAIREFQIMFDSLSSTDKVVKSKGSLFKEKSISLYSDPEPLSLMGYTYAVSGKRNNALEMLGKLRKLAKIKYVQPHHIAIVYIGLGDNDKAFAWLDKALADRGSPLTCIKVWSVFDALKSDPRYEALVRRMGLEP